MNTISRNEVETAYVIAPQPVVTLPVHGEVARFPVHRIFCVGRNYADHAREMGHDPNREPPFFFMKPADTIVSDGNDFPYPSLSEDVQHEVELVVALATGGVNIAVDSALSHVYGYAVGLDMTRRDLQNEAKTMGRPWDTGKSFNSSAPCSEIVPAHEIISPYKGEIRLDVNGKTRQRGNLAALIWNIPETIAYLSTLFTLRPGDLIFTGTPSGVGPVQRGDRLTASVEGVTAFSVRVA